jgi:hypothetical protein
MRYRPIPGRSSSRRRRPLTSKTIRLIDRITRDDQPARKPRPGEDSKYCD